MKKIALCAVMALKVFLTPTFIHASSPSEPTTVDYDTIIIGCGAAGLTGTETWDKSIVL